MGANYVAIYVVIAVLGVVAITVGFSALSTIHTPQPQGWQIPVGIYNGECYDFIKRNIAYDLSDGSTSTIIPGGDILHTDGVICGGHI